MITPRRRGRPTAAPLLLLLLAALAIGACGSPPATPTATPPAASTIPPDRPASPVKISIVSPQPNQVIHGTTVHVVVAIQGGEIVQATSQNVVPTQGHVHLYLDGKLIYMAYTLQQDITIDTSGQHTLSAEFVASDHFPFSPRDRTETMYFTVQP